MHIKLKENERSWAIQLIQDISSYVSTKPDFAVKKAGGETTINTGSKVMFPDVLLFGDEDMSLILQGWELKMPDVSINDDTFIKDSWRKAENLGLKSTVIWNFRYAVFYVKNEKTEQFEIVRKWDNSKIISSRDDVELQKSIWKKTLFEVIDEVNRFILLKTFKPIRTENAFLNNIFEAFIIQNKSITSEYLKEKAKEDSVFANFIDLWWDSASTEYIKDEKDSCSAYSKVLLLDWINKITFAHIIRSRYPIAEKVTDITIGTSTKQALSIFEEITKRCDFYSVFHKVEYQEYIPDIAWNQLIEINSFLSEAKLDSIEQKDMQTFLENAVKVSQRVVIGQYTTDYRLAAFLVRIAVKNARGNCLDPCCGTGTFARALLDYKIERGISVDETYKTVYAEDRQSFPLQITGFAMASKESVNLPAIVFQKNVFELKVNDNISIVNPKDGKLMQIAIPDFDTIVSNLPFIDFCRHNTKDSFDVLAKKNISRQVFKQTAIKLSDRSDYYMYIIFYIWNLLNIGGTACVLTSNSWMATNAGELFINALLKYFNIKGIIQSGNGRWFYNAKIVATAFLLEKKDISEPNFKDCVNFFLLNSTLKDLENKSVLTRAVGTVLQNKQIDDSIIKKETYTLEELAEFIRLNLSFNVPFFGAKWILLFKDKVISINKLFTIFRGAKTGQDEIFIPNSADVVDSEYVFKMLKNSKGCSSLIAKPDNIFVSSDKSYEELNRLGHIKTLNYFKQFEGKLNKSVLQNGKIWYDLMKTTKKASIITGLNPDKKLFFAKFEKPTCINQRLIGLVPESKNVDLNICHALLNSIIGMFFIESTGFGRGEGVLDLNKDKFANSFMLNPKLLSEKQKENILKSFEPLKNREILSVEEELKQNDRIAFDTAVLKSYGIEELYPQIKSTLLSMMKVRLNVK